MNKVKGLMLTVLLLTLGTIGYIVELEKKMLGANEGYSNLSVVQKVELHKRTREQEKLIKELEEYRIITLDKIAEERAKQEVDFDKLTLLTLEQLNTEHLVKKLGEDFNLELEDKFGIVLG